MKKYVVICLLVIFIMSFSSCASKSSIQSAENYLANFYQCFSQGQYTACFNQLNMNSSVQVSTVYGINVADFLGARSLILGPIVNYDIVNSKYSKSGDDKLVDFNIHIEYTRAAVDEQVQVVIKKDGQTSINSISFQNDNVASNLINEYIKALETDDIDKIKSTISQVYFTNKTERNLEDMIDQAKSYGGNLGGCEVIDGNYTYAPFDNGAYVYECTIKMTYENAIMYNKIKISERNGELGIGYSIILPKDLLTFFEAYTSHLKNEDKENVLSLYSEDFFRDAGDRETEWNRLLTYSVAYGELIDYEVQLISQDSITGPDGTVFDALRVTAVLNYVNKSVNHELVLAGTDKGYVIYDQYISSD